MPRISTLVLPKIEITDRDIGKNLALLRKNIGLTQNQLAKKMGITQSLISSYERGILRLNAEMLIRFSLALNTDVNNILQYERLSKNKDLAISLKILKRAKEIEKLAPNEQKALLKTIDKFIGTT